MLLWKWLTSIGLRGILKMQMKALSNEQYLFITLCICNNMEWLFFFLLPRNRILCLLLLLGVSSFPNSWYTVLKFTIWFQGSPLIIALRKYKYILFLYIFPSSKTRALIYKINARVFYCLCMTTHINDCWLMKISVFKQVFYYFVCH